MKNTPKTIMKVIVALIITAAVYSLLPVIGLYLKKDAPAISNASAIGKLAEKEGNHFAFIFFGDSHSGLIFNDSATLKLVSRMGREDRFKKIQVDFVLSSGDITFRGSAWQYRIFNRIRSLIKWPVICAMGNHDDDKGGEQCFKKYAGASEFAFSDRNSYFIAVDDSGGDISEDGFSRLEAELKKSSACAHRFVILHKSPVSLYHQSWYRPELSMWSYRFMKLCEKYKVDMVLSGHEHIAAAREFGGVKYITSGGGGILTTVPSGDNGVLHYVLVRVYGDYVDYEVRKVAPPFWEFLVYYMWKDAFYLVKDAVF